MLISNTGGEIISLPTFPFMPFHPDTRIPSSPLHKHHYQGFPLSQPPIICWFFTYITLILVVPKSVLQQDNQELVVESLNS